MNKRIGLIIFLIAMTARVIYLQQLSGANIFYHPIVDSGAFNTRAAELAHEKISDEEIRFLKRLPFYQIFLATIYKLTGYNLYFSRLVQAITGSLSCLFIFFLGCLAFNRAVGIIAGFISSLYWPLIAFGAKFLPVNLAIFFSLISILCLQAYTDKKGLFWTFAAGVFLALSALSRSNVIVIFPLMALWLFIYSKKAHFRAWLYCLVFISGFILVLSPSMSKFYQVRKEVVPIQDNYGVGIYFGSDLELIRIKPGATWNNLMMELLDEDLVKVRERNMYFLEKTRKLILSDPVGYARTLGTKIYILFNYYEFSPRECINYFRSKSTFLSMPLFNFGSIIAFSILGMLLAHKTAGAKTGPVYVFTISYALSLVPFMPLARYRLPVVPFIIVFASYGISVFAKDVYNWNRRGVIRYASVLLPVFLLTNINPLRGYLESFTRPHYYEGLAYASENEYGRALSELHKALKEHPRDADIYSAMGNIYFKTGDTEKARASYKKALSLVPRFPEVVNNLGITYAAEGEFEKAEQLFIKASTSFPVEYASAHINLGNLYRMRGEYKNAEKEYQRAIYLEPDNAQALHKLATLYEETNEPDKARAIWEKYTQLTGEVISQGRQIRNLDKDTPL